MPPWVPLVEECNLQGHLWISCPGGAGMCGNGRAGVLDSEAPITGCFEIGRRGYTVNNK